MTLQQWAANGWLRSHETSPEEIANLFRTVDRDLADAADGISPDWRFGIAYNGALKLCTIILYASGYRSERQLQHYRTIHSLPIILGGDYKKDAAYLRPAERKETLSNMTTWVEPQRLMRMNLSVSQNNSKKTFQIG